MQYSCPQDQGIKKVQPVGYPFRFLFLKITPISSLYREAGLPSERIVKPELFSKECF